MSFGIQPYPMLWGLGALGFLALLLIHLWNRKEGRRILVGSIQWLDHLEEKKFSRIKFSEFWRFLLRFALIGLFFLLLLQPFLKRLTKADQYPDKWLLVDASVQNHPSVGPLLDSFALEGFSLRQLAPEPEEIEGLFSSTEEDTSLNYWSLLRRIAQRPDCPDTLDILGRPSLRHFSGPQPALPFFIQWIDLPETEPEYFLVYSWKNGDKVVFLIGQSSSEGTFFEQKVIEPQAGKSYSFPPYPDIKLETVGQTGKWQALSEYSAIPVKPSISQKILIQAEAGYKKDQKYLEAALKAVARFTHTDIQINPVDSTGGYDWIFHLSENVPTPEMQDQARNLLVFEAGLPGADLIFQSGRHYILSQHLNPDNFTELPSQLLSLLFESEVKKLNFPDNRGITLEQRNSVPIIEEKKTKTTTAMSRPLHFWVWTVLLLLFLTERIYRPKND